MPTVADMGWGDLQNEGSQGRQGKPLRHLMAQDPEARWNRAPIVAQFSFAGDHQNKAAALRMGSHDECGQGGMGLRKGHAVQIDPALWLQLAALHFAKGLAIHIDRRCTKTVHQSWKHILFRRGALGFAANFEHRNWVARLRDLRFLLGGWRRQDSWLNRAQGLGAFRDLNPKRLFLGR